MSTCPRCGKQGVLMRHQASRLDLCGSCRSLLNGQERDRQDAERKRREDDARRQRRQEQDERDRQRREEERENLSRQREQEQEQRALQREEEIHRAYREAERLRVEEDERRREQEEQERFDALPESQKLEIQIQAQTQAAQDCSRATTARIDEIRKQLESMQASHEKQIKLIAEQPKRIRPKYDFRIPLLKFWVPFAFYFVAFRFGGLAWAAWIALIVASHRIANQLKDKMRQEQLPDLTRQEEERIRNELESYKAQYDRSCSALTDEVVRGLEKVAEQERQLEALKKQRDQAQRSERKGEIEQLKQRLSVLGAYEDAEAGREDEDFFEDDCSFSDDEYGHEEACDVLGLRPDASFKEIRKAYLRMVRDNHPDRVAQLDPAIQRLAEKRTKVIMAAFEFLRKRLKASEEAA